MKTITANHITAKLTRAAAAATLLLAAVGCNGGEDKFTSVGLDDSYAVVRMQKLKLATGAPGDSYMWRAISPDGTSTLLSDSASCIFVAATVGTYTIQLDITDGTTTMQETSRVAVIAEEIEYSGTISAVYDYLPAPGQFINTMPEYEEGDTRADMNAKALASLQAGGLVSLGACGGYMIFGFDHTVANVTGAKDFALYGNAVLNTNAHGEVTGGSAEPGAVYVSLDENGNGLPDDPWYELAGSEHGKSGTLRGYTITYRRPDDNKTPVAGVAGVTDCEYIAWSDNAGGSGYVEKNTFHPQNYYPQWINADELTYTVTRLPANGTDVSGNGSNYVLKPYDWGYADNHPNSDKDKNSFDISWAIDEEGNSVYLPGVDFIKVSTAVIQSCGWVGETSTEISGAEDLHL